MIIKIKVINSVVTKVYFLKMNPFLKILKLFFQILLRFIIVSVTLERL